MLQAGECEDSIRCTMKSAGRPRPRTSRVRPFGPKPTTFAWTCTLPRRHVFAEGLSAHAGSMSRKPDAATHPTRVPYAWSVTGGSSTPVW